MISAAAIASLKELVRVIQDLPEEAYSASSPLLNKGTIGQHVRHIIEFYQCLENGLSSGVVNYDLRKRDLILEVDRQSAILAIESSCVFFESAFTSVPLQLEQKINDVMVQLPTTLERELLYNIEHAIHHLAIFRIVIEQELNLGNVLNEGFGVAQSTLEYRNQHVHDKLPATA